MHLKGWKKFSYVHTLLFIIIMANCFYQMTEKQQKL